MRSEVGHVSWRSVCLHPSGGKDVALPYALFNFTGKRLGFCPGREAICDFVTQNMAGICSITHRGGVLNMRKKICKKVTCCFWQVLGRFTQFMFFIVILLSIFSSTRNTEEVCCLKKD